ATAEYTYTFAGWTPELAAVTGETTYTATFTATKNSYTITFINEDGTILQQTTVEYGTMPVFSGETPTKEATAQYTYTFANWTPEIVEVTGDATYTAVFTETVNKYTVTWIIDGETETEEYEYGAMPAHADPTKEATAQYTYTFSGWTPEVVSVTGNATYTAQFTETVNKYTVTWIIDGTEETEEYEYGAMPTHADPTKEATAQYTYTFSGWTPELAAVTGDATYTAQFTETVNKYTVTWIIDGTEETEEYEYGAMPTHADPTKEATAQYTYTFSGWTPAIAEVTGDATYTAVFTETVNTFTVTFLDWDGTVIGTETVAYGSAATAPAAPEHSGYAFTGWDTAFDNITADTTVTAQYAPSPTLIGDINLDGKVDSTDALLAMRYSMGITLIEGQGFVNGDVNGDGVLNATDGLLIMRIALAAE
ncbi:MAG: InlB B-repeat-containing protein, partial [Clostridia bacterium]|nr:InlB B-repeat-containing protein [Clostridia bacterium]